MSSIDSVVRRKIARCKRSFKYIEPLSNRAARSNQWRVKDVLERKEESLFERRKSLLPSSSTTKRPRAFYKAQSSLKPRRISFHVRLRFPPYITLCPSFSSLSHLGIWRAKQNWSLAIFPPVTRFKLKIYFDVPCEFIIFDLAVSF